MLAATFGGDGNPLGIGFLGVALAFGLTVLTGAYAFGHVSGAHFNPAVSVGLWAGGRFPGRDLLPYIVAQVLGGLLAGFILLQIASGAPGFAIDGSQAGAFASNGYGALSPGGYSIAAAFLCEVVLTAFFLVVIMGATHGRAPAGFAPVAIGLAPDPDSPDQHPGDQHLGESGTLHGRSGVCRQWRARPAVAVLVGPAAGRADRWHRL